jgi:hypothetical protein
MPDVVVRGQRVPQASSLVGRSRLPRQFRTSDPLALRADLERLVDALQRLGQDGARLFPTARLTGSASLQFGQLAQCADDLVATLTLQAATDADAGRLYGIRIRGASSSVVVKDATGATLETLTAAGLYLRMWGGAA